MQTYYAVFVPEDDGKFSVWFPDLPGCASWGDSLEHAYSMAMDALEGHLEAMADDGDPIPEPSSLEDVRPMVKQDFAEEGIPLPEDVIIQLVPVDDIAARPTRVNVSFRKSTLGMIDRKAEAEGMTRSGFLSKAAEAYCCSSK